MRFLRDALITILLLIVVVIVVAYARIHAGGLSADAAPGRVEKVVATKLVRLSIPADADQRQNPFRGDANAWMTAADHYEDHCAVCHGVDGRGHTDMGENMYPKVPDLNDADVQQLSDGTLFYIIQNGVRWTGMPGWKHEHSEDETWRLVSFMRKIPSLTVDDLARAGVDVHAHDHDHHHEARD